MLFKGQHTCGVGARVHGRRLTPRHHLRIRTIHTLLDLDIQPLMPADVRNVDDRGGQTGACQKFPNPSQIRSKLARNIRERLPYTPTKSPYRRHLPWPRPARSDRSPRNCTTRPRHRRAPRTWSRRRSVSAATAGLSATILLAILTQTLSEAEQWILAATAWS